MNTLHQSLRHIRLLLQAHRLLSAACAVTAMASVLWLLFALADLVAAFEPTARVGITIVIIATVAIAGLAALVLALKVSIADAARRADEVSTDPRRSASGALSLHDSGDTTPLAALLTARTLDSAATHLATVPLKKLIPWKSSAIAIGIVALPLAVILALALLFPKPATVIGQRLLHPSSDLAPYSRYRFDITPQHPAAIYGGELLVTTRISGGTPQKPVEYLIRRPRSGETVRLPAFRESSTRFSRKLDGLTEPIEIAFAIGKARSAWHPVEILLAPNILSGTVRLAPPPHTALKPSTFALDTNEIAAIEGSTVTLDLLSNRPLGSGTAELTPASTPGLPAEPAAALTATIIDQSTASFTWIATRSGRLTATLTDLRGTPCQKPLEINIRVLPDLPPVVELSSPPRMLLATPSSQIPVTGRAEDDFALSAIRFVRTLSGFRDRSHTVAGSLHEKAFDFTQTLDLHELGLEPGQTIELMLDASDHNPSLLGQGSSDVSRIRIISEEDYANYIRARTTIEQFSARFSAAKEAIDRARKALEALKQAADQQKPDEIAAAAKNAERAHQEAAELLEKIANDFPAFDLEKRLQDLAAKQADDIRENIPPLQNLDPGIDPENLRAAIDEMLERLGRRNEQADPLAKDLKLLEQAAGILEMAAEFRRIYEAQKSLSKRFETIVEELFHGEDRNRRLLPSLADSQDKNRDSLDHFETELRRRVEALPKDDPMLSPLATSALQFLNQLELAAPESFMEAASKHGRAGQANDAFTNAELARALLERLMSAPDPFPQAASGQAPQFGFCQPDVNKTLEQLLNACLGRIGEGAAGASGLGMGGTGPSGSAMPGIPMDVPVIGPERLEFTPLATQSRAGGSHGSGGAPPPLPNAAETSTLRPETTRDSEAAATDPERIPEPYREAVKRYMTP